MSEPTVDYRNRPVVFQTQAEPEPRKHRRPIRVLATITLVIAALAGATGLAYGGSAVWSVVGPKAPANEPAPLWLPEQPVVNKPDGGFDRSGSNTGRTGTSSTASSEPGDDRGGGPGGAATTGSGSGTGGGSGRSSGGPGDSSGNHAHGGGDSGGSQGGSGHN